MSLQVHLSTHVVCTSPFQHVLTCKLVPSHLIGRLFYQAPDISNICACACRTVCKQSGNKCASQEGGQKGGFGWSYPFSKAESVRSCSLDFLSDEAMIKIRRPLKTASSSLHVHVCCSDQAFSQRDCSSDVGDQSCPSLLSEVHRLRPDM